MPPPESPCVDHAVNDMPPQSLRDRRLDIRVQSAMLEIHLSPAARPVPRSCGCDSMAAKSKSVPRAARFEELASHFFIPPNTKHRHPGGRQAPSSRRTPSTVIPADAKHRNTGEGPTASCRRRPVSSFAVAAIDRASLCTRRRPLCGLSHAPAFGRRFCE